MIVLSLTLCLLSFVAALHVLGAASVARDGIGTAAASIRAMRSPELDDDEKERRVRRGSMLLMRAFALLVGIVSAALLPSAGLVWAGAAARLYDLAEAFEVAAGWPFILFSTCASGVLWIALTELRGARREA